MTAVTWQPVSDVDVKTLAEARRQAHNSAQWLVRVAHSFMKPADEDRHALLHWDPKRGALVTEEFLPNLTLELQLAGLTLQFRERDRPSPHVLDVDDRTPAAVEAWVLVELLHRRLDRDRFSKDLPYEFPNLMTGDAVPYSTETLGDGLRELSAWFDNGASVLAATAEDASRLGRPGTVWCWPQVFHLGALVPSVGSSSTRTLRIGMSPGDDVNAQPYFYVTRHDPRALMRIDAECCLSRDAIARQKEPAQYVLDFLKNRIAKLAT
jgi:hypothetical protein